MTATPPRTAAIYARISQDRAGAGVGVDRQLADCRQLAERLGWTVGAVHTDNDISAYSGKPRPGYRALLADLSAGRVDAVLVWHTDRLHRSPVELEEWIAVCEPRGIATHTVQAGTLDLATPSGRMVARMLGSAARYESEHKGERVRAARRQAAQEGRYSGGKRPFGFEADGVTLRPTEVAEIVKAADALLAGAGLRSVVRAINERGIPTTFNAGTWSPRSFKDVMLRPRNAGLATYRGEIVGPASWPAILPEEQWRAVVALLTDPARRTTPVGAAVRWLGSGLYVCSTCHLPRLRVSTSGQKSPAYRCNARESLPQQTGHVSRAARPLDEYVERIIVERLTRPDAVELLAADQDGADTTAMHAEALTLRQRLDQLADAHADGEVTLSQLTRSTARMRARLDAIDVELAAAAAGDPLAGLIGSESPAAMWATLDIGRRRAVLDALMTVTVLPRTGKRGPNGQRFDPDGVRIEWKR